MRPKQTRQQLQDRWERAIERAAEEQAPRFELDTDTLGQAAGLHVSSGVSAGGLWGATKGCSGSAACPCTAGCG